jgi:hypothetical protein
MQLYDLNVRWRCDAAGIEVVSVAPPNPQE